MGKRNVNIFECDANDCLNKATVPNEYDNPKNWMMVDTYREDGTAFKPLTFCPEHADKFVDVMDKELLTGE